LGSAAQSLQHPAQSQVTHPLQYPSTLSLA
jgi:hypothetical protein